MSAKRCEYCGEVLPVPDGRHGFPRNQRFCGRRCYTAYLKHHPRNEDAPEPSDEEKAEIEARRAEIWQRNFGHIAVCDRD